MNVLAQAYEAIETESPSYDRAFDKVDELLAEFGETDLAERVFAATPRDCDARYVGELFNILYWSTSDGGAAIRRTLETWLREAKDIRKATIALHSECYPFVDAEEMYRVLDSVGETFPQLKEKCQRWIEMRKRQSTP